jgi:hypothetical protein
METQGIGNAGSQQNQISQPSWAGDPNYVPQPQHVCPNCGYCPCCGRQTFQPYRPYPFNPYPWGVICSGTNSISSSGGNYQIWN